LEQRVRRMVSSSGRIGLPLAFRIVALLAAA
jgi:hypothetical protein